MFYEQHLKMGECKKKNGINEGIKRNEVINNSLKKYA